MFLGFFLMKLSICDSFVNNSFQLNVGNLNAFKSCRKVLSSFISFPRYHIHSPYYFYFSEDDKIERCVGFKCELHSLQNWYTYNNIAMSLFIKQRGIAWQSHCSIDREGNPLYQTLFTVSQIIRSCDQHHCYNVEYIMARPFHWFLEESIFFRRFLPSSN